MNSSKNKTISITIYFTVFTISTNTFATENFYPGLLNIDTVALASGTIGISGSEVPFQCDSFSNVFFSTIFAIFDTSKQFTSIPLSQIVNSKAYQSIKCSTDTSKISTLGLKSLQQCDSLKFQTLRNELRVNALLIVNVEYSVVELYKLSQEYRLRVHILAKLIGNNYSNPFWQLEFDDDTAIDLGFLLGLKMAAFGSPSQEQWHKIMNDEVSKIKPRATNIAIRLTNELNSAFQVSTGEKKPSLLAMARTGKWWKLGEWPAAGSSLLIFILAFIPVGILCGIVNKAGENSFLSIWLGLPAIAGAFFLLSMLYYFFKALF